MQNIYQKIVSTYSVYVAAGWLDPEGPYFVTLPKSQSCPDTGQHKRYLKFNNNGEVSTFNEILPHCELLIDDFNVNNSNIWNPYYSSQWAGSLNSIHIKLPVAPPKEQRALAISVYASMFPTFMGLVADGHPYTDNDDMDWLAIGEYTNSIITMAWEAHDLGENPNPDTLSKEQQILLNFRDILTSENPNSGQELIEKFLQKTLPWNVNITFETDPHFKFVFDRYEPLLSVFENIPRNTFTYHPPVKPENKNAQAIAISEYCKFTNATAC
ncbi:MULTISPECIES: hypothetical protein [Pseudoalteromonas]|uniref:Uncharacterized protein n=1 Tax=Pseudoalteromonas obscura TaxID=3048491 RepID=A0ABT7EMB4_9GAMM|nr:MULTISPECIES: hypothetical protein [Pseudoalteromonas]MBQ4837880.1 hypothetical protein [Pseudoalteromonas luteoviolacea]MDK2596174.1 hypothetical protein [Pseudoalteromonas sp. P94(2023)]